MTWVEGSVQLITQYKEMLEKEGGEITLSLVSNINHTGKEERH